MELKKISRNIQDGELILRDTGLDEICLCVGMDNRKRLANAIWWNNREDMIADLTEAIRILKEEF